MRRRLPLILSLRAYLGTTIYVAHALFLPWPPRLVGRFETKLKDVTEIKVDADSTNVDDPYLIYEGPVSSIDDMIAGTEVEELGLTLMVGPSKAAIGLGLFVAISDDLENVEVPKGTPLCGYSKGEFTDNAEGDKTVAYLVGAAESGVIFNKKLMPLSEALEWTLKFRYNNLTDALLGHFLLFDHENSDIIVSPDPEFSKRYFIPAIDTEMGISSLGVYANDLAYVEDVTVSSETYAENSDNNVLSLVWRFEGAEGGTLNPTWPVIISNRMLVFTNREPMELGLHYSWRYWFVFISL